MTDSKTEIIGRDKHGRFTSAQEHGGPGRKPGSLGGRQLALRALDVIIGRQKNIKKLEGEFQTKFWANPLFFFRTYVMPLLPKQIEGDGIGTKIFNVIYNHRKSGNSAVRREGSTTESDTEKSISVGGQGS